MLTRGYYLVDDEWSAEYTSKLLGVHPEVTQWFFRVGFITGFHDEYGWLPSGQEHYYKEFGLEFKGNIKDFVKKPKCFKIL